MPEAEMVEHSQLSCTSAQCGRGFAAIIPVGPALVDLCRAVELIKSILLWQPDLAWCVVVDDFPRARGLSELALFPPTCRAVTLMNPRQGRGRGWSGGLVSSILTALSWIESNTDADFVLKVDTDALVIGPFANAVRSCLARLPEAGVIGTVGPSCNPSVRGQADLRRESHLLRMHRLVPPASLAKSDPQNNWVEIEGFLHVPVDKLRSFDSIRPHIRAAVHHGYVSSEYCQGGAYVVTRSMVDRMAAAGCLARPEVWVELPFCEDMTIALYARAVGLHVYDCSGPGEPFGVQYRGLPYPPEELVSRGYSLIHSIRNDPKYSEAAIRQFFANRVQPRYALDERRT